MSVAFELATAERVVFGAGCSARLPDWLSERGFRRVLLVTGRNIERTRAFAAALKQRGIALERTAIVGEPTVEQARAGAQLCRQAAVEAVVGWGGGAAVDAGKAIAALTTQPGDVLDYLEVVGRGQPLSAPSLPFVAVPTTAGPGAEVTRNAVLSAEDHRVKASLRSPAMLPRLALVDPELLAGAPMAVLRASGLDALSQLIEPLVSVRANPVTDAWACAGIAHSRGSLRSAVLGEPDASDLENLALASLFGGLSLANSGLGAVHGFAAPIGGMFSAPHGAVCAALLPHVMRVNIEALRAREPQGAGLLRYARLARLLTDRADAQPEEGVAWMRSLCSELDVQGLRAFGVGSEHIPELVQKGQVASSMRGNPLQLTVDELADILTSAL